MQEVSDETGVPLVCQKVQELDLNENPVSDRKHESPAEQSAAGDNVTTTTPDAEVTTTTTTEEKGAEPVVVTNGVTKEEKWEGLGFRPEVLQTLSKFKLGTLTDGQKDSIRTLTEQSDPVCLLESGTERTITFLVKAAMMQNVDPETLEHQLLILTPTRIAGLQVTRIIRTLGDGHGLRVRACIGGTALHVDIERLRTGVQVVIGTTGRITDLLDRCMLNTSYFKFLVLENADEMLEHHRFEVWHILKKLPADVRVILLSAQMTPDLVDTMNKLKTATVAEMEALKPEQTFDQRPRSDSRKRDQRNKQRDRPRKGRRQSGGSSSDRQHAAKEGTSDATTPVSETTPDVPVAEPVAASAPEQPAVVLASA